MKSKVANGKFNIFLGKVFNEKIERFLDNLFEYVPFEQATIDNARFYKEILKITPSFVSLLTARNGFVYVYTTFGYFIVKLYHNIYGEQIAIILDVVFSYPYNNIYSASSQPSNLSPLSSPLSFNNSSNMKYRVIGNAGYGFQIVKGKDGKFNYINSDGKLLYPRQWFKEVKPFNKTPRGIIAFVNNNGICNAIDSNGAIYDMNRSWKDCFTEGKIKKDIMTEAINKISNTKRTIRLTKTELKGIIAESVKRILSVAPHKIGNWERVPSNGYEFHDIPSKGKCVGIAMYVNNTTNEKIPPTYCLFRRGSNGKYFYATIVDAPEKGPKETKFLTVPVSNVPQEIRKDLHNLNLLS